MAGIFVKIDKEDLAKVESAMTGIKNGYKKVLVRSLNKTITGVCTDAVAEISKEITPKKKRIRDTFEILKANYANLSASIKSIGWPLPLIHYLARPVKTGVSFKIWRRAGKRSILKGAFIAVVKAGEKSEHKGVFWRKYKDAPGYQVKPIKKNVKYGNLPKKPHRLPIRQHYGPAVPSIMEKDKVMKPILEKASNRLSKELDHQLEFELSKL